MFKIKLLALYRRSNVVGALKLLIALHVSDSSRVAKVKLISSLRVFIDAPFLYGEKNVINTIAGLTCVRQLYCIIWYKKIPGMLFQVFK